MLSSTWLGTRGVSARVDLGHVAAVRSLNAALIRDPYCHLYENYGGLATFFRQSARRGDKLVCHAERAAGLHFVDHLELAADNPSGLGPVAHRTV